MAPARPHAPRRRRRCHRHHALQQLLLLLALPRSAVAQQPSPQQAPPPPRQAPHHSTIPAYAQCGGELGLCKTTTIGVPCGDHPWDSVNMPCPTGYACERQTNSYW